MDTSYHVFNRSNGGRIVFPLHRNYHFFTRKLVRHVAIHGSVLASCLMPTHFHLVVICAEESHGPLRQGLGVVLRSYTRALQRQERFTGSLFQQRTRFLPVVDRLESCITYLHQNPLRAGLVADLSHWPYSSYHTYLDGRADALCESDRGRTVAEFPQSKAAFHAMSHNVPWSGERSISPSTEQTVIG